MVCGAEEVASPVFCTSTDDYSVFVDVGSVGGGVIASLTGGLGIETGLLGLPSVPISGWVWFAVTG